MKKFIVFLVACGLILYGTSPLFAGGVDNKHNWSAEYIRTYNRNAATDAADATVYNPAGVMKMESGFYGNLGLQYIPKDYTNTVDGVDLSQDEPSIIPGLFALYKQDRWALFGAFTIPSGGGKVDYAKGNATTRIAGNTLINTFNPGLQAALGLPAGHPALYSNITNERVEAESYYYGFTIGGAYKINDMVSVSLGVRFIDAYGEAKTQFTITADTLIIAGPAAGANANRTTIVDYEKAADGWGGIFGVNIAPSEQLNIGLRYETPTRLDFEYNVKQDTITGQPSGLGAAQGIIHGKKVRRDLPAILGLGASYKFTPKIKVDTTLTWYFQKDANWNGDENDVGDGYDLGIALEYIFTPKFKGSLGYLFTETSIDAKDMSAPAPQLDANSICGGIAYEAMPGLMLNLGIAKVLYESDSYTDTSSGTPLNIEYSKDVIIVAFGIEYKFF